MDSIFELLLKKYNKLLDDLTWGFTISQEELAEVWNLLHILHYASFEPESNRELFKILDYYGD